jgi:hypothetical protein
MFAVKQIDGRGIGNAVPGPQAFRQYGDSIRGYDEPIQVRRGVPIKFREGFLGVGFVL